MAMKNGSKSSVEEGERTPQNCDQFDPILLEQSYSQIEVIKIQGNAAPNKGSSC